MPPSRRWCFSSAEVAKQHRRTPPHSFLFQKRDYYKDSVPMIDRQQVPNGTCAYLWQARHSHPDSPLLAIAVITWAVCPTNPSKQKHTLYEINQVFRVSLFSWAPEFLSTFDFTQALGADGSFWKTEQASLKQVPVENQLTTRQTSSAQPPIASPAGCWFHA